MLSRDRHILRVPHRMALSLDSGIPQPITSANIAGSYDRQTRREHQLRAGQRGMNADRLSPVRHCFLRMCEPASASSRLVFKDGSACGNPGDHKSNGPPHHNIALSEGGYNLESLLPEHRDGSPVFCISPPPINGIGLDVTPSLLPYRIQGRLQRSTRYPALAIPPVNDKASYSPQSVHVALSGKPSITSVVINTRKLLLGTVLAPSNRLSFRVDEYPMRASVLHELSPLSAVSRGPLDTRLESLALRQGARSVIIRAPALISAWCWMGLE